MNQRGMTLLSALMSISVAAIALISTFRMVDRAVEVFATLQGHVRAIDTAHEIRFAIGQAKTCTVNFNDVILNGEPVRVTRKLYYPLPTDPTLKSSLEIAPLDSQTATGPLNEMVLRREASSPGLAYLDLDMNHKRRSIPLIVRVAHDNRITCCSSMEVDRCED